MIDVIEPKEIIYNRGSSEHREDGVILSPPFYGVLDGVSAPYSPDYPMQLFRGMSGGAFVSRIVERQFARIPSPWSASQAVLEVNKVVWRKQRKQGASQDGGELAGASFAVAKVSGDWVEIVQGCDAFALWVMKDGSIGMTETQNTASETYLNQRIVDIMKEVASERGGDLETVDDMARNEIRAEMWDRFYPILVETRREYVNNPSLRDGYGLLNGQLELKMTWFNINLPRSKVKTLLLFTDGMVPWWGSLEGLSSDEIAREVYETYCEG
ncbi:MAG: hypothetical protein HYS88_00825, partial [Candidatus Colwellbacteria bacterium]|nr:hypothetical protein [Candidatus Colwellbacteria bacterium]